MGVPLTHYGKVVSVDENSLVTHNDGFSVKLGKQHGLPHTSLKAGQNVQITFEVVGGENIARRIDLEPDDPKPAVEEAKPAEHEHAK